LKTAKACDLITTIADWRNFDQNKVEASVARRLRAPP